MKHFKPEFRLPFNFVGISIIDIMSRQFKHDGILFCKITQSNEIIVHDQARFQTSNWTQWRQLGKIGSDRVATDTGARNEHNFSKSDHCPEYFDTHVTVKFHKLTSLYQIRCNPWPI